MSCFAEKMQSGQPVELAAGVQLLCLLRDQATLGSWLHLPEICLLLSSSCSLLCNGYLSEAC